MFLFKPPPSLRRCSHPIIRVTESLKAPGILFQVPDDEVLPVDVATNALVLDARTATTLGDLTWLYRAARKHSNTNAFRKVGGRVVVIRSCPDQIEDPEAVAVSEAIVGFAKSLAKENGSRGATVNLLRDATLSDQGQSSMHSDALNKPLEWLLSHNSCYVAGQELVVVGSPRPASSNAGAMLITGAAGGIGKETAKFLSEQDPSSNLVLVDHPSTESQLAEIASDLKSTKVDVLPLDLTQTNAGEKISQTGIELGGLGRIIHAAGITRDKTLRNMDYESSWRPVMEVNLRAAIKVDEALLSTPGALHLANQDNDSNASSSFVYFSSTSGISGNAGQSNYAASKSGLLGYAKAMAHKYPCNAFHVVSPGFIETEMTQQMPFLVRLVASRLNALGQAGTPQDVAAAVAFLSSPDACGLAPGFHLRVCGMFMGGR